jgi:apolipoprotein N-acyltransferase
VTLAHPHSGSVKPLLLALLVGAAGAFGFEPFGLWPLTIAAFALLLWMLQQAGTLRRALALGYWFGVGHFAVGLNWIATAFTFQAKMPAWLGWIAVVLLAFYLAVYPAMATGLAWRWSRTSASHQFRGRGNDDVKLVLLFAAAWTVTEYLRATLFTGFAWNPEGVALLPTSASWLAPLIGTYGLSAVLMLIAGTLLLLAARQWKPALAIGGGVALASLLAILVVSEPLPSPNLPVRIVQPNIGQQDKWQEDFEERNFARHANLSRRGEGPRLLLWPEAAVTQPLVDERRDLWRQMDVLQRRDRIGRLLGPNDVLITGGLGIVSQDGETTSAATNSVFALSPRGEIIARYDKAHLVPYGEYLPMRPLLSAIGVSRLAPGDTDFRSGPGPQTLDLPLVGKVGFQLCYEIIFSGQVVDPENRPGFLFNPSNDAWFGRWGPPQHLAQARLRALEEGLPVLRSTPTGISAVVDAEGRLLASLPWREAGVIDSMLPAPKPPTLFARFGNLLPFLFAGALAAIAVAMPRKAR